MSPHALVSRLRRSLSATLLVALALGMLSATAFVELADEVLEGEATPIDRVLTQWLHDAASPALVAAMRVITVLGSGWVLVPVVALVAGWALWRRRRALAGMLVAVSAAGEGLNVVLKLLFERPRPDLMSAIMRPSSYSFPSGHAMLSIVVYGAAAYVIARLAPRLRWPLAVVTPILVVLIGLSRVVLGVHWPSDVVAGFAAGGILLAATLIVATRWPATRE